MAIPASITPVTVTGRYIKPDGSPAAGSVRFQLSAPAAVPVDKAMVPLTSVKAKLDDNTGAFSAVLAASDDPDWAVSGLTYQVTERITGAELRTYNIDLRADAPRGTVDLATLAPAVAGPPLVSYVLAATVGAVGGPAGPLDATGKLPAAQVPASAAPVQSVAGKTGAVVLVAGDVVGVETPTGAQDKADAAQTAAIADAAVKADAAQAAATTVAATDATNKVATHAAVTAAVHGIADTAALETQTGAQAKADAARDAAKAASVAKSGDTMTGPLSVPNLTVGGNAAARTVDIQSFTVPGSNFTWTKPAGAQMVEVIVIGAGGGGGSGRRGAASTIRCGGGGGGGGGVTRALLRAADLPDTCPVLVGNGGGGGSSFAIGDNQDGAPGGTGGASVFNDITGAGSNANRVKATGGGGGSGGTATTGLGGGAGFALFSGGGGGAASTSGFGGAAGSDPAGAAGGSAGGGISAANVAGVGGNGGVNSTLDQARAPGGAVPGGIGGVGRSTLSMGPGNAGGGGAASITGPAGAGGGGGSFGGGGGGGGAALNGFAVGAGAAGSPGAVFVITYF